MNDAREGFENDARAEFERIARTPDPQIDLAEAALRIAAEEYPGLDVAGYLARLDDLAHDAAPGIESATSLRERVAALNRFLFDEQRFSGNASHYYDPRNSYLNEVIDRRCGIPISLALVYMAVGQRLSLDVRGVSFPGHFLVKCVGEEELLVDAFAGALISREACQQRLRAAIGRDVPITDVLRAASPREILVRMISNLKQIFVQGRDFERALSCCERILLLTPDAAAELRDRAGVYAQLGFLTAAAADLDRFVEIAPDDPFAPVARRQRDALRRRAGPLH
jgi:regulator of sirC expression with transglutaminase-like and TPR domain